MTALVIAQAGGWFSNLARNLVDVPAGASFGFDLPAALGLLLIPLGLAAIWLIRRRSRPNSVPGSPRSAIRLPMSGSTMALPTSLRARLSWLPGALIIGAACLLIVALARPQLSQGRTLTSSQAVAIKLVVDRSPSMGLHIRMGETYLTRMDAAKQVLREFVLGNASDLGGRASDLVGLVSFARFAETNCPLVADHRAVAQLVDALDLGDQSENGTAIGDGLALAAARLRTAEQELAARPLPGAQQAQAIKSKVIVLLTDGANNAGEITPMDAATLCSGWGIKVYAIGLGGPGYVVNRGPRGNFVQPVQGDLNTDELAALASLTGGLFREARDGQSLRSIYAEIDRLEKSDVTTADYTEQTELFAPLAIIAAALIAIENLLRWTWLRRLGA
jgi:Ca-activated chloride channel homolog